MTLLPNRLIFLLKILEKLLHCKSFSQFLKKKNIAIFQIQTFDFNEMLTNDDVSFEQLGPVVEDKMS